MGESLPRILSQARCRIKGPMLPTLKNLPKEDVQAALEIELASYPADEAASLTSLTYRQEHAFECFRGAYLGDKLVGFICGTRTNDVRLTHDSMEEHVHDGKTLCIHSVVVDSNYRKKGYGKFMLKEYIKYVQDNSAKFGINKMLLISKIHLRMCFMKRAVSASLKNAIPAW